jgi:hypothetical protein
MGNHAKLFFSPKYASRFAVFVVVKTWAKKYSYFSRELF